jgi:CheY-like chemotaxis protein
MRPRVLLVDDEEFIVAGLRIFLEDEGMQVASAASGEEAVNIVRKDPCYDVCIMDMRLPGMSGDKTIRALQKICARLKFIIHTGSTDYSIPDELRTLGISQQQIFAKPLQDMKHLAETVAAMASNGG